jgi:glutathione S-transferase
MSILHGYGDSASGNCWKVKAILARTRTPFDWTEIAVTSGATRSADFLALNPNGKVPVIRLPDGRPLAESNAILAYVADGSPWLPTDRYDRALVFQWLFFEQYSHEPYIATSRYWLHYLKAPDRFARQLAEKRAPGLAALAVMESHLQARDWFVGARETIADLALYAYTHVAHEGGFPLDAYPAIRAWLARVAADPTTPDLVPPAAPGEGGAR